MDTGAEPLTTRIAEFVATLQVGQVPARALRFAQLGTTDCVGVLIAGSNEPPVGLLRNTLGPKIGDATLLFGHNTAPPLEAAFINGTAAHALDYDDVGGVGGHPSAVIVPAILAEAEALNLTGQQALVAYVVGYEVWGELSSRERGSLHVKGWHPTSVWGAIAAAAACSYLHGLKRKQVAAAIGLAASQSGGIMANFGTMTKPFHAGRAAYAGVMSCRLAAAGYTAAVDAIEHPQGLLSAVSQAGDFDCISPVLLGQDWRILASGVNIKKYPACYCTHRAIDAMLQIVKENDISVESIRNVSVATNRRYATVLRNHEPKDALAAKFSMEFAMASCVIANQVSLNELRDDFVRRRDVQELMQRVEFDLSACEGLEFPSFDRVSVLLDSGKKLVSEPVADPRGHLRNPLSEEELFQKFASCLRLAGREAEAPVLYRRLENLNAIRVKDLVTPVVECELSVEEH